MSMDNSVKLFQCYSIAVRSFIVVIFLQIGATLCCANFNYAFYDSQSNVVKLGWELRFDDHCQRINGLYNITINRCNGELHNLSTSATEDDSGHIEVTVDYTLCGSKCTVQFQGAEGVYIMLLNISATHDRLMYHCDGGCIPMANDIPCIRYSIEYHSNSTGMFARCARAPISNGTCIMVTDLGHCLSQAKNGVLLIEYCNYQIRNCTSLPDQLSHFKCESNRNWLNQCTTLVILRSQIFIYNTTNANCESRSTMTAPPDPKSTMPSTESDPIISTSTIFNVEGTTTSMSGQSRIMANKSCIAIFTYVLLFYQWSNPFFIILTVSVGCYVQVSAISFGESDAVQINPISQSITTEISIMKQLQESTMMDQELCILVQPTGTDSCISESNINNDFVCIRKYLISAQRNQMTTMDLILSLLSLFLALLTVHKLHSSDRFVVLTIILVLFGKFHSTHGLQFGESDLFVREGPTSRSVAIRRQDTPNPLRIRVFSSTISQYKQNHVQMGCNLTLDDLDIQESQIDPAEDSDLQEFERDIIFDADVQEVYFDLEVYDDQLSEKEEYFILSLNSTEHATDRCAVAVSIKDNDRLIFNFSASQVIIDENAGEYLNLSIIKIGENEPNVTIDIAVRELHRGVEGSDFDVFETHYVFDNETSEQTVRIQVYDDHKLGIEEHFELYFPALTGNGDVQLITLTSPYSVTVIIQDNEVAVVGFKMEGDVMLQEGGGSAKICAGFDSMDGVMIDSGVDFILIVTDLSPVTPGTGHDLTLKPSDTLYIYEHAHEDCLDVSSPFDTNLNESKHVLSLQIRGTSVSRSKVIFSRQYLNVYIADYHGLVFISEPSNITTGMKMDVHFNCDYIGTHASPLWTITQPTGTFKTVSTARLPRNHFSTGKGLAIRNVDESHNMTSYACHFQIYNKDEIVLISSRTGTLVVLDTITFQLSAASNFEVSQTIELFQGDSIPSMTIRKLGYSADTFIVIMRIKSFNNDRCNTTIKEQILWYAFDTQTYEHTLLLGDELPHSNNYLVEMISPVSSIEMSGAHVLVPEPLHICIFDKDFSVGFTEQIVSLQEGMTGAICLTTYDHKIHNSINLNFTLQLQDGIDSEGCVILERNFISLNSTNATGCSTVSVGSYEGCNGKMNITVVATHQKGMGENNVTFLQPFIIINLTTEADDNEEPLNIIILASVIPSVIILILCSIIMILSGIISYHCRSRKGSYNVNPTNTSTVDSDTLQRIRSD